MLKYLEGVLVGHEVDDLESVANNADGEELQGQGEKERERKKKKIFFFNFFSSKKKKVRKRIAYLLAVVAAVHHERVGDALNLLEIKKKKYHGFH